MKRPIVLILFLILVLAFFAGCNATEPVPVVTAPPSRAFVEEVPVIYASSVETRVIAPPTRVVTPLPERVAAPSERAVMPFAVTVAPPTTRLPVLAYHSILGAQWYYPYNVGNPWILSEDVFAEQMRYLYENGYTTISAAQLYGFLFADYDLPPNAVLITFDDGYLDNAVYAAPIMREFGFTGIIFVITGLIADEPGELTAEATMQWLSYADMYAIADVFEFGSHTHDMHHLEGNTPALLLEPISEIRADLQRSFEFPLIDIQAGFAYPFGRHSGNAMEALRAEGVPFAFVTSWGYVERDSNPLLLHRFSVTSEHDMAWFSRVVSGDWVS